MAKRGQPTIGELQDEIKHRDKRIEDLRAEVDELREKVRRMAEHCEDASNYVERFCETFDMVQTDEGWTWGPFWDQWNRDNDDYNKLLRNHNELVRKWNSYVPVINGANEKQRRPVGRPLGADESEIAKVQNLHNEGRSLRGIVEDTELSFSTVRSIVDKIEGRDRGTKTRWQRLHQGEKWQEREYTPIAIDRQKVLARKRQRRTGHALPKQAQRLIEEGRELVKEAKR